MQLSKSYPVVALTGPRQSGKTTLVKDTFKEHKYVSLEDFDNRRFAVEDPRGFLAKYSGYVIIDEAQNAPELFSYIQGIVDNNQIDGQFILTGSQNFLLLEKISQSLAGRVAISHLLPFDLDEIDISKFQLEELIFRGFYPRLYVRDVAANVWYSNYLRTYIERDIRQIKNIHDLNTFQLFLKMCASRAGQILDLTSLGNDCGISHNTAKAWLNILEASFIVYFLRPYFKNYGKRLIKSPKLYFYDTGLLCSLLEISSPDQLKSHYLRGGIFETFVISSLLKNIFHSLSFDKLYFWRDSKGGEIDCIIDQGDRLIPIEIKSSKTISSDFFKSLNYWTKLSSVPKENAHLVYGGVESQKRTNVKVIGWRDIHKIMN